MRIVPGENEAIVINKTKLYRLRAAAAADVTNKTISEINQSGQTWRWMP